MEKQEHIAVVDFEKMLLVRNQLVYYTLEDLEGICQDENKYFDFVDSINLLLKHDETFLYLDESFVLKVEEIVQKYRFTFNQSDSLSTINAIISQINLIKCELQLTKDLKLENYLNWQEEARGMYFSTLEDFIITLAEDSLVYEIFCSNLDDTIPSVIVYSSLNYFTEICPQVFKQPEFYQNAVGYLDHQLKKRFLHPKERNCVIETKENVQKVKKGD